jgi:tetratricopeptide (TPR) repeat protein
MRRSEHTGFHRVPGHFSAASLVSPGLLIIAVPLLLSATVFWTGCSSAPKGQQDVRTQRRTARSQLEAANKETDRGNYPNALTLINEARRLAISADDSVLLVRAGLSRGNIYSYMDRPGDAQADFGLALAEAERIGDTELAAISRIYIARSRLLSAVNSAESRNAGLEEIRDQVRKELGLIKKEQTAAALGWTVIGLAEKELGRWTEAENAVKSALDIHTKEKFLESAAYDWYLIASIRSVAGQYIPALKALDEALALDRRTENTYGLGSSWKAIGDVYNKAENTPAAEIAYRRSAEIFRSINLEKEALGAEKKIKVPGE